jgi:hypothetical protein
MVHRHQILVLEENVVHCAHTSIKGIDRHAMGQCLGVKKAKLRAAASEHRDLQSMRKVLNVHKIIQESPCRVKYWFERETFSALS